MRTRLGPNKGDGEVVVGVLDEVRSEFLPHTHDRLPPCCLLDPHRLDRRN